MCREYMKLNFISDWTITLVAQVCTHDLCGMRIFAKKMTILMLVLIRYIRVHIEITRKYTSFRFKHAVIWLHVTLGLTKDTVQQTVALNQPTEHSMKNLDTKWVCWPKLYFQIKKWQLSDRLALTYLALARCTRFKQNWTKVTKILQ